HSSFSRVGLQKCLQGMDRVRVWGESGDGTARQDGSSVLALIGHRLAVQSYPNDGVCSPRQTVRIVVGNGELAAGEQGQDRSPAIGTKLLGHQLGLQHEIAEPSFYTKNLGEHRQ